MSNKKKIVHILYSFGTGGLEKGIATLICNSSSTFRHIIICLSTVGDSVRLLPQNTQIISLNKKQGNSIFFILRLAITLKKLNPDIVHTRNWSGMDGILAARLVNIKTIVHGEHGWDMADPYGTNSKRVFIRRFFSRWVKEYTCVSKQMVEWLKKDLRVTRPVTQIYNGVDTETYHPKNDQYYLRKKFCISENAPVIGIVSRLDPIKDHQTLFQAFWKMKNKFSDARLFVVGDGPERQKLESIAGKGIVFLGNRADVPDIMREFNVFVLTSLNEGISNTILEAMASGLPIVATRVGGNLEIIENGSHGIFVDPQDSDKIADALIYYFENKEIMRQHGGAARKKAVCSYSIQSMVERYEAVYSRVIQN